MAQLDGAFARQTFHAALIVDAGAVERKQAGGEHQIFLAYGAQFAVGFILGDEAVLGKGFAGLEFLSGPQEHGPVEVLLRERGGFEYLSEGDITIFHGDGAGQIFGVVLRPQQSGKHTQDE